jgi:hypothetical protein
VGPKRVVSLPHPIIDESGHDWVASRSTASVVGLTSGREALLVDCARAGVRLILVTQPGAKVTFALYQLLTALNGVWLTRESDGLLRHAVGGEVVDKLSRVMEPGYVPASPVAPEELLNSLSARVSPAELSPWLQFTVAVHHPARMETSLGGVAQSLVESVTGSAPVAWGTSEPVSIPWDRDRLTALARVRMPRDSRVFLNGGKDGVRYSGSMRIFRSDIGVTEETRLIFASDDASAPLMHNAAAYCERIAAREQVLIATAWAMRGAPDATILPYWPTTPQPVAAVLGARAVRSMDLDTEEFELGHHATVIGNRRTPALVVDFGGDDVRWQRFAQVVHTLGPENLAVFTRPPMVRHAS